MANILVFGDSIGFGDYDTEGGWVDRLKRDLLTSSMNDDHNIYVYNLSISGDTTEEILKRLENETIPRDWESKETIFIFPFGINDSIFFRKTGKNKVPINKFKANLEKIANIASKYSKKIIFIGPTPGEDEKVDPMPWSPTESFIIREVEKYNEELKKFCKARGYPFLNLYMKFRKSNYMNQLHDGAHPNTKGHETIYKEVKKFLKNKKYI